MMLDAVLHIWVYNEYSMNNKHTFSIIVRRSILLPITRIALLQFMVGLAIATLSFVAVYFADIVPMGILLFTGVVIILLIFDIIFCVFILLRWWHEYYIIKEAKVIHRKGVLYERTQTHHCERIESITVEQSLLGKIMDHGDIQVSEPPMQQELMLYGIPQPKKHVKIMRYLLLGEKFNYATDERKPVDMDKKIIDEDTLRLQ